MLVVGRGMQRRDYLKAALSGVTFPTDASVLSHSEWGGASGGERERDYLFNRRMYLAQTYPQIAPVERLNQVCRTPSQAFNVIAEHEGEVPPGGEPDWSPLSDGKIWGWAPTDNYAYVITEWKFAGVD